MRLRLLGEQEATQIVLTDKDEFPKAELRRSGIRMKLLGGLSIPGSKASSSSSSGARG